VPKQLPLADTAAPDPVPDVASDQPAQTAVVVNDQTVQIASPDQVNEIDLAADDSHAAEIPADNAAPASQAVFAAPTRDEAEQIASKVGSAAWIAQAMAALSGAVAAGAVAWFLIGAGPQRTYG
jgi:hypothetical protein